MSNFFYNIRVTLYFYLYDFSHIPNETGIRRTTGIILGGFVLVIVWEVVQWITCRGAWIQIGTCSTMELPFWFTFFVEIWLFIGLACIVCGILLFRDQMNNYKAKHPEWGESK